MIAKHTMKIDGVLYKAGDIIPEGGVKADPQVSVEPAVELTEKSTNKSTEKKPAMKAPAKKGAKK